MLRQITFVCLSAAAVTAAAQPVRMPQIGRLPITNAPQTTEMPWSVRIDFSAIGGTSGSTCTGSALTAHWIITAAHCLRGKSVGNTEVAILYVDSGGVQRVAYARGRASYYNHPDYGGTSDERIIGDRGDDIGLIRLYGAGLSPEQNAPIYSGKQKPWNLSGKPEADVFVAGYGKNSGVGGTESCSSAANDGIKRLGKFALTGDTDDDGFFGTGPAIAIQASNKYGHQICDGDSGAAWAVLRWGRYLVLGVHSGSRTSTSWTDKKWAAVVDQKFNWIVKTTRDKGLPIVCGETIIRDHRSGTLIEGSYKLCRDAG